MARPSLRLLAVMAALCLPLALAASAQAEPAQLTLTGTTPESKESAPANSTTPRIHGNDEGIIKSVVARFDRFSAVGNLENTVRIYTDSNCESAPVASGTLNELEGLGIQVEVAKDSATTFYATQTEVEPPNETSKCSKGLTYYESSTVTPPEEEPPGGGGGGGEETPSGGGGGGTGSGPEVSPAVPVAPHIHMLPGMRANDNDPIVLGSASGAERVKIFASDHCAGIPIAEGLGGALSAGIPVHVPDNSETAFTALSLAGSAKSECSDPTTYVEDSTGPHTRITMGPGSKTRRRKAVFRFADVSGDPTGTTFKCKLDHHKWKACHSPFKIKHLGYRVHVLRIRGTDVVGNPEAKPAKRRFKVVHGS